MSAQNESTRVSLTPAGQRLLAALLCNLPLAIPGSRLESGLNRLYAELEGSGISFKPAAYLSDSWGCPSNVPIVGIPFYLANPAVYGIVNEFIDPAPLDDAEIIRYLRHECGHALNYAYLLHRAPGWETTFGLYAKPYRDNYKSIPFDPCFVRHATGWYAQKHPDEDFAETFAVWLDPVSMWRERYAGTPVMPKLLYIENSARRFGPAPPVVTGGDLDRPLDELHITLSRWCRQMALMGRRRISLPAVLDADLKRLFPAEEGAPAGEVIAACHRRLVRAVHDWTGVSSDLLNSLVYALSERAAAGGLKIYRSESDAFMPELTAFVTTLAMNYQYKRAFIKNR